MRESRDERQEAIFCCSFGGGINFVKKLELSKYGQGGTIVHLYYNHFKEIELCFPPPKEQQKIASCLSSLDSL
jgi:type I restriction enzyme S subunit